MKYFTLKELCASSVAEKAGIDNTPDETVIKNLNCLVDNLLDPVREQLGEPLYISSCYRCQELNKIVLGSPTSQHVTGCAADIYARDMEKLLKILKNMIFDQLIIYKHRGFYHVSYNPNGKNRMQIIYRYSGQ